VRLKRFSVVFIQWHYWTVFWALRIHDDCSVTPCSLVDVYEYMYIDIFVNCNWVDTRWQQYRTHLHTNSTQNNTNTQNNIRYEFYINVTVRRNRLLFNNQPDALIIQIYPVIKFYMFRASSLPIIRSFLLYIRHW
jgi:hypothetical protein